MEFTAEDTTYFPVEVDANNNATETNVGYFVGGSTSSTPQNNSRSLTFANYPKASIFRDISNNSFADNVVYTIDEGGVKTMSNVLSNGRYTKYKRTKKSFETNVLAKNANIGGFHFYSQEATLGFISEDSVVEAERVRVADADENKITKAKYELPVQSLDFKLLEQGRINFLAGMYNGGYVNTNTPYGTMGVNHMNGFFSLHRVFRNTDETISHIREIKAIYSKTGQSSYVYSYVDGNNIVDEDGNAFTETSDLTLLFDTKWIGHRRLDNNNQNGRVYYFEIPVDAGEYCLGGYRLTGPTATPSAGTDQPTTADGAYLMYLDIGANAARTTRTTVAEHFLETSITSSYPNGVALVPVSVLDNDGSITDSDSVCVVIEATYYGELVVQRDANSNVKVTRAASYRDVARPSYISNTIQSVVDPGYSNADLSGFGYENKVDKETYRLQYYDYNIKESHLIITKIEDTRTKTNDGSWSGFSRKIFQTDEDENNNVVFVELTADNQSSYSVFRYDGPNGDYNGDPWEYTGDATENIWNTSSKLYYNGTTTVTVSAICETLSSSIIVIYHNEDSNVGVSSAIDFVLNMIVDNSSALPSDGTYYKVESYTIVPVVTSGQVRYVVQSIDGSTTIVFYFVDENTVFDGAGDYGTATAPQ